MGGFLIKLKKKNISFDILLEPTYTLGQLVVFFRIKAMTKERIGGELLKGHVTTLVLAIVGNRPSHGYEIMKTLAERTEGVFELGQGTIYPLLYSLEEQHLIRSKTKVVGGRTRRVYYLTNAGRKVQKKRMTHWQLFQEAMNNVLQPNFIRGLYHART